MADMMEQVAIPAIAPLIEERLYGSTEPADVQPTANESTGFLDVLAEGIGRDYHFDPTRTIGQLSMALAVAPNPDIAELTKNYDPDSSNLITALREEEVLKGFKILDASRIMVPGLAIVATLLGAEVHTVGNHAQEVRYARWIKTHTILTARDEDPVETVKSQSGDDFDFITSNGLGVLPEQASYRVGKPGSKMFAPYLLVHGGHQYDLGSDLFVNRPQPRQLFSGRNDS